MDQTIWNDISYGMYIIATQIQEKKVGCFINTLCQISSRDKIVSVSLNKDNYTNQVLKTTKRCAISILSENTSKEVITRFGYFSSKDIDKFDKCPYEEIDHLPVVLEEVCGYLIGEVIDFIDCGTHEILLIKIRKAKKIGNKIPMTYKYYHETLRGKTSAKAPTYVEEEKEFTASNKYKCKICGYVYDDAKEKIKFDDLPSDWKCPACGVGKEMFEQIK